MFFVEILFKEGHCGTDLMNFVFRIQFGDSSEVL